MKKAILLILLLGYFPVISFAQNYTPLIEPCPCLMKVDQRLKTVCGNLVVPENRQKPNGNKVKIPFVFARRPDQDSTRNIVLMTTGGPGYATISPGDSMTFNSGRLAFGGFISFDQRGTKNAKPCLDCEGIDEAIRRAYTENLSKDSLVAIAVTNCRQKFIKQGIDLSAYNTVESAADISDLIQLLKIKSVTLLGISYSGGLMLTVVRNHPESIKSLLLNSPLPSYVNYEEHALFNHQEALNHLFDNLEADSVQNNNFPDLRRRFQSYFTSISGSRFTIRYLPQGAADSLTIHYSKNELLDAVIDRMNNADFKNVPAVIRDLINGQHEKYIREVLDGKFRGNSSLSYGMRLSVYCSEQIAYSDKKLVRKQDEYLPWLSGYPFNNVNHEICDCWKVKPAPEYMKTPVYSNIPALVSSGGYDPWTRPFYNRLIRRTMPNAQLLLNKERAHVAGFGPPGTSFLTDFIKDPYRKLVSTDKNTIVE